MNEFLHSGDLGDVIAGLPAIRACGGGRLVISHVPKIGNRESMEGARFDSLRHLVESQSYIHGYEWRTGATRIRYDLSIFRHDYRFGENLADWQARHLGVTADTATPWLAVSASPQGNGRVVIARSQRYHNDHFPWRDLLRCVGDAALFVGFSGEHEDFERATGCAVEHALTGSLLELAQVIAGCSLFIGNQSCPFWIAAGLGVPLVQEVYLPSMNSIVLRENAHYPFSPFDLREIVKVVDSQCGLSNSRSAL